MPWFTRLLFLSLALFLSGWTGCADMAYWQQRNFYGIECRPEYLKNGQCVPVKAQAETGTPAGKQVEKSK